MMSHPVSAGPGGAGGGKGVPSNSGDRQGRSSPAGEEWSVKEREGKRGDGEGGERETETDVNPKIKRDHVHLRFTPTPLHLLQHIQYIYIYIYHNNISSPTLPYYT